MLKRHITIILIVALLCSVLFADDISISRLVPSTVKYGDNLNVVITVTNNMGQDTNVTIRESVFNAKAISPQLTVPPFNASQIAAIPPYLEWTVSVGAGSSSSVNYTILPNKVGQYTFPSTVAILPDGRQFQSKPATTQVLCNANGVCEPQIGENYLTCPQDCQPWAKDGICNPARDGHCDPDCAPGVDLDCLVSNNSINTSSTKTGAASSNNLPFPIMVIGALFIGAVVFVVLVVIGILYWRSRKKGPDTHAKESKGEKKLECPSCRSKVGKETKFCANCGAKIAHSKQCKKCKMLLDNSKFCPHCGAKAD